MARPMDDEGCGLQSSKKPSKTLPTVALVFVNRARKVLD
jgi:hypothetical protein